MAVTRWWCCSGRRHGILRFVCACPCVSAAWWLLLITAAQQSGLCAEHNETAVVVAFRQADWPGLSSTLPLSSSSNGLKPLVFLLSHSVAPQRPQGGEEIQAALTSLLFPD